MDGGSSRRAAVKKMIGSLGGTMEAFYYAFGAGDVYLIVDVPDNVTAAREIDEEQWAAPLRLLESAGLRHDGTT